MSARVTSPDMPLPSTVFANVGLSGTGTSSPSPIRRAIIRPVTVLTVPSGMMTRGFSLAALRVGATCPALAADHVPLNPLPPIVMMGLLGSSLPAAIMSSNRRRSTGGMMESGASGSKSDTVPNQSLPPVFGGKGGSSPSRTARSSIRLRDWGAP